MQAKNPAIEYISPPPSPRSVPSFPSHPSCISKRPYKIQYISSAALGNLPTLLQTLSSPAVSIGPEWPATVPSRGRVLIGRLVGRVPRRRFPGK